ncbi:hypothetical protein L3X38_029882 [Prunus dulcis]|uniref:Uncharacterized protein n=1 Tax=Prunus dulcis TaxID=3755 RepID=A0AAD4VU05_PRUDU|nr:hypothetical protein L3X38_029882 [Prunus dulcis]
MGGRDGPKLRRLGFMARRAYEPSSSPLVFASRGSARNLHEIFESVASKKFHSMEEACEIEEDCDRPRSPRPWLGRVKRGIFRPIHCIASTSSKIFRPFVKLENAKRPLTTGMVATEKAWDLEMIMMIKKAAWLNDNFFVCLVFGVRAPVSFSLLSSFRFLSNIWACIQRNWADVWALNYVLGTSGPNEAILGRLLGLSSG